MARLRDLRSFRNIFVNSRMQGVLIVYCLGAFVLGCGAMALGAFALYTRITPFLAINDTVLQMKIISYFATGGLPLVIGVCLGIGLVTVVPYALYFSHKTAGPIVPIRRYIKALTAGDLDATLKLRDGDELQELAHDLQQLAQALKAQKNRVRSLDRKEERPASREKEAS